MIFSCVNLISRHFCLNDDEVGWVCEVCINVLTFLVSSLFLNFFVTLAVSKVTTTINQEAIVSYEPVYYWPVLLALAIFIMMSMINLVLVFNSNKITMTRA